MWGHRPARRVGCAEAMKMRHLVSVGNRQGKTRNTRVLHLRIHVGVNLREIRRDIRTHMPRRAGGSASQESASIHKQQRTDECSADAEFHIARPIRLALNNDLIPFSL